MNSSSNQSSAVAPSAGLVEYTHWIYALHTLSVLTALVTSTHIVGRFVFGLPSIIAVIMNYARRGEAHGSYLASHFVWQIRTFWYALLCCAITLLISAPLILVLGLGVLTAMAGFGVTGIWVCYRIVRGWVALRAGAPMPVRFL